MAWSPSGNNTPEEFKKAWRYVVGYFNELGATNAAWVWSPWKAEAVAKYYPGNLSVDWIGLTLLNYGSATEDGDWHSFEELYAPFAAWLGWLNKPIMLAEFGSTSYGGDQSAWLADALGNLASAHPEIHGAIFFHSDRDKNWPTQWRPDAGAQYIDWTFDAGTMETLTITSAINALEKARRFYRPIAPERASGEAVSSPIIGAPGEYQLIVDGAPFYIRGVAYGVGEGWRSGGNEPTRRVVDADFSDIARLGANTVRRYGLSWADRNILNAAEAQDLKVMMGFWLEAEVDYLVDTDQLAEYEARIIKAVKAYRDHPAVLSWTVGNETWGTLKHRFSKPYLTEVRRAYVRFVDKMARRIKEIDPARPVFTSLEYSLELPGALTAFARGAPSIDALGINAYYARDLADLDRKVRIFANSKPYLISEFGPNGYWDPSQTRWNADGFALEPDDTAKAEQYANRWRNFVADAAGRNIGGVAFTWTDRLEGSYTWFGLTDANRRRKAAYFSLQSEWAGEIASEVSSTPVLQGIELDAAPKRPGGTITARLKTIRLVTGTTIDWRLLDEASFEDAGKIDLGADSLTATIRLPGEPGRYRLYVWAESNGNVATANVPVLVK